MPPHPPLLPPCTASEASPRPLGTPMLLLMGALLAACSSDGQQADKSTKPRAVQPTPAETRPSEKEIEPTPSCEQRPGHRYELITLPPEFAPGLASGQEELWFAPGMFKAEAPDYFHYRFSLRFDEAQPASAYPSILHDYFSGLMSAVATGKSREHKSESTRVELRSLDSYLATDCRADDCVKSQTYFVATIHTVDEFVTGNPITLHALLELSGACARFSVQPQAWGSDAEIAKGIAAGAKPAWPCLPCDSAK